MCHLAGLPTAPPALCDLEDVEVLFVIDGSNSIKEYPGSSGSVPGQQDWTHLIQATRTIAAQFRFGCTDTPAQEARQGIIQFAGGVYWPAKDDVVVEQQLTCDAAQFDASLGAMHSAQLQGWTYTGDALAAAVAEFDARGRSGASKAVVLITDGVPCRDASRDTCSSIGPAGPIENPEPDKAQAGEARRHAATLKGRGITLVTVGVGSLGIPGAAFLDEIASAGKSFAAATYTELDDALLGLPLSIASSICTATHSPTDA
eukprot:gene10029-4424_t